MNFHRINSVTFATVILTIIQTIKILADTVVILGKRLGHGAQKCGRPFILRGCTNRLKFNLKIESNRLCLNYLPVFSHFQLHRNEQMKLKFNV